MKYSMTNKEGAYKIYNVHAQHAPVTSHWSFVLLYYFHMVYQRKQDTFYIIFWQSRAFYMDINSILVADAIEIFKLKRYTLISSFLARMQYFLIDNYPVSSLYLDKNFFTKSWVYLLSWDFSDFLWYANVKSYYMLLTQKCRLCLLSDPFHI